MDPDLALGIVIVGIVTCLFGFKSSREFIERFTMSEQTRRTRNIHSFEDRDVLASSRWSTKKQLKKAGYLKPGGIRIGPLFYHGVGHILIIAGARTGKFFTVMAATILSLGRRSLFMIDQKAEMISVCGRARKRWGKVIIINSFGICASHTKEFIQGIYNPFDIADVNRPDFHVMCEKIADAFRPERGAVRDPHWWDTASAAISGTIAALKRYGKPEQQNLMMMRQIITGGSGRSFYAFCRSLKNCDDRFIREKLAVFAAPGAEDSNELKSVLSTMATQTKWLANEASAKVFGGKSNFRFRDLRRYPGMTICACLPLKTLDICYPIYALLTSCMLAELMDCKGAPVLAIIDEAAQIPWFKAWQDAWAMAAGAAGIQIMAAYQNLGQIMTQMGDAWQVVLANSGCGLFFGVRDQETRELVSQMAGTTDISVYSKNVNTSIGFWSSEPTSISESYGHHMRNLINPDEVGSLTELDGMIVLADGIPPTLCKRTSYLKEFRGQYRDNPYYQKKRWFGL